MNKYIYIGKNKIAKGSMICGVFTYDSYKAIEVSGEHNWQDGQILVEGEEFEFEKRQISFGAATRGFEIVTVAVPREEGDILKQANGILRSCLAVIERRGNNTNWEPLEKIVRNALEKQHKIIYPTSKEDQKKHLIDMMQEDQKDGLYQEGDLKESDVFTSDNKVDWASVATLVSSSSNSADELHNAHNTIQDIELIIEFTDLRDRQKIRDIKSALSKYWECQKSMLNNEPNLEPSVATGDAILTNPDNKKPNPVKEGERLFTKEEMMNYANWLFKVTDVRVDNLPEDNAKELLNTYLTSIK